MRILTLLLEGLSWSHDKERTASPHPDGNLTAKAVHKDSWEKCPDCAYVGTPAGIRLHQKKAGH